MFKNNFGRNPWERHPRSQSKIILILRTFTQFKIILIQDDSHLIVRVKILHRTKALEKVLKCALLLIDNTCL